MDEEWEYHQDSRDEAASMGCFAIAAVLFGAATIAITVLLV